MLQVANRREQNTNLQLLRLRMDSMFCEPSYRSCRGCSAHKAVAQARQYVAQRCDWVADIDPEKFFDRGNHDVLTYRVPKPTSDKQVLELIRAFLTAGVMENWLVSPGEEGTPQEGPLFPFLSNLYWTASIGSWKGEATTLPGTQTIVRHEGVKGGACVK